MGLVAGLAAAFVGFALVLNHSARIADWLFFRYAGYALAALFFTAACLSSGHALVRRVLGGNVLPVLEHVAMAFAAGVYVFFLGTMIAGFAGLLGHVFFFVFPLLLIAAGARPTFRYARRARRHLAGAWRRSARPPAWALLVDAFGLVGLALVYIPIMTPNNAAFDARWYHLGIAEHYAAAGAVGPFYEGWLPGTSPHLASLLYTWAFLVPGQRLGDRVEVAAHLEYAVFVFSVFAIPALVRRLVRPRLAGQAYRYAWAARFLFPGVFLYDSSVCLGADHVAAVFAAPVYLALLRAWTGLAPRACVLLALALSGALLSKYTGALILVAPAVLAIAIRAVWLAGRALFRRAGSLPLRAAALGPLVALGAGLAFTAPHWAKNIVFYRDPAYPVLRKLITPRPWTVDSALRFDVGFQNQLWAAERSLAGLGHTMRALATFSFVPNDWKNFHGDAPVFGSLFTLALVALPFLKGTKRLWGIYASCHVGVFVWYWINHQDRYLQAALPWMAAATAAVIGLAWREGRAARVMVAALAALQIVWGADVFLIPAHVFAGVPVKQVLDMFSHPVGKPPAADRIVYQDAFTVIGKALPHHAKVLIHETHPHLGVAAPSVADCPYHQGGISYLRTPTPRDVFDQLSSFGVTHIAFRDGPQSRELDTLAGEIVFFNFVHRYATAPAVADGWLIAPMPKERPAPGGAPDPVLLLTCGKGLPPGLYHLEDLTIPSLDKTKPPPHPFSAAGQAPAELVQEANAVAQEPACAALPPGMDTRFVRAGVREPYTLWVRK